MNIFAQAIGIVAMAILVFSYQFDNPKKTLVLQAFAGVLFATHFALLGAMTGAMLNIVGIIRSVVYAFRGSRAWADHIAWPIVFSIACIVICIFTWTGIWSLLPMIAMVLTSFSLRIRDPRRFRYTTFPSSPLWLTYNSINFSIGGILAESFTMVSIIVAVIRFEIIPKYKKN